MTLDRPEVTKLLTFVAEPRKIPAVLSPEEMTRALVRCLNHPQAAREQAERGRETVASRYDWASLAERLERVWEKAVSGRTRSMSTAGQG